VSKSHGTKRKKNIQLDLNKTVFLESWFALETAETERVRGAFEKNV
jgi:hypothetical protein